MSVDDSDATATAAAAASTPLPPMETFFFSHFGEIRQGEGAATITAAMTALDDKWAAIDPADRAAIVGDGKAICNAPVIVPRTRLLSEVVVTTDTNTHCTDPARRAVVWWKLHEKLLKSEQVALRERLKLLDTDIKDAESGVEAAIKSACDGGLEGTLRENLLSLLTTFIESVGATDWCDSCCACDRTRVVEDEDRDMHGGGGQYGRYGRYNGYDDYSEEEEPIDEEELVENCTCECGCPDGAKMQWVPIAEALQSDVIDVVLPSLTLDHAGWEVAVSKLASVTLFLLEQTATSAFEQSSRWRGAFNGGLRLLVDLWCKAVVTIPAQCDIVLAAWALEVLQKLQAFGTFPQLAHATAAWAVSWSDPRLVAALEPRPSGSAPTTPYFEHTFTATARLQILVDAGRVDHALNFALATQQPAKFVKLCFRFEDFDCLADNAGHLLSSCPGLSTYVALSECAVVAQEQTNQLTDSETVRTACRWCCVLDAAALVKSSSSRDLPGRGGIVQRLVASMVAGNLVPLPDVLISGVAEPAVDAGTALNAMAVAAATLEGPAFGLRILRLLLAKRLDIGWDAGWKANPAIMLVFGIPYILQKPKLAPPITPAQQSGYYAGQHQMARDAITRDAIWRNAHIDATVSLADDQFCPTVSPNDRAVLLDQIISRHLSTPGLLAQVASKLVASNPTAAGTARLVRTSVVTLHTLKSSDVKPHERMFTAIVGHCASTLADNNLFRGLIHRAVDGTLSLAVARLVVSVLGSTVGDIDLLTTAVVGLTAPTCRSAPLFEPTLWLDFAAAIMSRSPSLVTNIIDSMFTFRMAASGTPARGSITKHDTKQVLRDGGKASTRTIRWNFSIDQPTAAVVSPTILSGRFEYRLRLWPNQIDGSTTVFVETRISEGCGADWKFPHGQCTVSFIRKDGTRDNWPRREFAVYSLADKPTDERSWQPTYGNTYTTTTLVTNLGEISFVQSHRKHAKDSTWATSASVSLFNRAAKLMLETKEPSAVSFLETSLFLLNTATKTQLLTDFSGTSELVQRLTLEMLAEATVPETTLSLFERLVAAACKHNSAEEVGKGITLALNAVLTSLDGYMSQAASVLPLKCVFRSYADHIITSRTGGFTDVISHYMSKADTDVAAILKASRYNAAIDGIFNRCAKLPEHSKRAGTFAKQVEQARATWFGGSTGDRFKALSASYESTVTSVKSTYPTLRCSYTHGKVTASCKACRSSTNFLSAASADYLSRAKLFGPGCIQTARTEILAAAVRMWNPGSGVCHRFVTMYSNDPPPIPNAFPEYSGCDQAVFVLPAASAIVSASIVSADDQETLATWLASTIYSDKPDAATLEARILATLRDEEIDREVLVQMTAEEAIEVFQLPTPVELPSSSKVLAGSKFTSRVTAVSSGLKLDQSFLCHEALGRVLSALILLEPRREFWTALQPDGLWMAGVDDAGLEEFLRSGFEVGVPKSTVLDALSLLRGYRNALEHSRCQGTLPAVYTSGTASPKCRVVAVGSTGAGKSTLLNAVLGEVEVTPTNAMRACTATIVEMEYLRCPEPGVRYTGLIEFVNESQWKEEIAKQLDTVQKVIGEGEETPEHTEEVEEALARLAAVYGSQVDYHTISAPELLAENETTAKLGTTEHITATTAAELSRKCAVYIDSANELESGAMWPLVKRVTLHGPWGALACGATLVDAPGLHDSNTARGSVVRAEYRNADSLWLISNIKRAVNDKTIRDLLPQPFRTHLVRHGVCGQVIQIATQADVCVRSEIVSNLKLPETATLLETVQARSTYSKTALTAAFFEGVERSELPVNDSESRFGLPCVAASAVECQKLSGVRLGDGAAQVFDTLESTEVPALQRLLLDATVQFSDPDTRPTVAAGDLLLRFEPIADGKSADPPLCDKCTAALSPRESTVCAICLAKPVWPCSYCDGGVADDGTHTFAAARACAVRHNDESPPCIVNPTVGLKARSAEAWHSMGFSVSLSGATPDVDETDHAAGGPAAGESAVVAGGVRTNEFATPSSASATPTSTADIATARRSGKRPATASWMATPPEGTEKSARRRSDKAPLEEARGLPERKRKSVTSHVPPTPNPTPKTGGKAVRPSGSSSDDDDQFLRAAIQASIDEARSKRRKEESSASTEDIEVIDLTLDD